MKCHTNLTRPKQMHRFVLMYCLRSVIMNDITRVMKRSNKKGAYWYKFYEYYCPVCGNGYIEKERVYDEPKPQNWSDRHIMMSDALGYDQCM